MIGVHGLEIVRKIAATKKPGMPVNILTHCNAGWLATVDWGTATSRCYTPRQGASHPCLGRRDPPRNQGAALTAWELNSHGMPHTSWSTMPAGI
jgi:methylthioribose-1-phosphate isomerase